MVNSSSKNESKFWALSDNEDTSDEESSNNILNNKTTKIVPVEETSTSYEYTLSNSSSHSSSTETKHKKVKNSQLSIFNAFDQADSTTKRYQAKMLLASLIEHFCHAYGDTPDANRKVFFLICQTLRSFGIIDAEFVDEMTSVRSAFQQAFHKLFFTAVQTVRNQDLVQFDDNLAVMRIQSPTSPSTSNYHYSTRLEDDLGSESFIRSLDSSNLKMENQNLFYNLTIQNSRYNNDFVESDLLGKGGFASAFRARNRLDGIHYAIKKIRLGNDILTESKDRNPYEKIFREIKNLARLEHQNVIRYYSSWLEMGGHHEEEEEEEESEWEEETDKQDSTSFWYHEETNTSFIQFGESSKLEASEISCSSSNNPTNKKKKIDWILFIQMQLCPTTLHDYIKYRNRQYADDLSCDVVDTKRNIEIFTQILEGTAYIHDQGLIHRDLKPSNIFLNMPNNNDTDNRRRRRSSNVSTSDLEPTNTSSISACSTDTSTFSFDSPLWDGTWVPKIGDFGLAADVIDQDGTGDGVLVPSSTPASPKVDCLSRKKRPIRTRTIGVGTRTYASPEQLAVPAQAYDEKSDIYSLGIILFELYQPFATGMERADSIEKLKRGVFPKGFLELFPKVSALILWMMDPNPQQRPSAHQLLDFELFSQPSDIYFTLRTQLQSKMNLLERKDQEIEQLKSRVQQLETEKANVVKDMQQQVDDLKRQLSQDQDNNNNNQFLKKQVGWSFV